MSMRYFYLPAIICMALVASSCLDEMEDPGNKLVREQDEKIVAYLNSNNIEASKDPSGVYYQVLQQNKGIAVKDQNIVSIHYVLRDLQGNLIDSLGASTDSVATVSFYQNPQSIVPVGLYIGANLMNVGEKFRLFIPSYRAYQNFSYKTLISSNEIVVADIEVVKVESLDSQKERENQAIESYIAAHALDSVQHLSSGIYYQKLAAGDGAQAKTGDAVKVSYTGIYLNDTIFDQSKADAPLEFIVGRNNYIKGFDEGVKQMRKGEKARIFIPSELAYGASLEVIPRSVRDAFLKEAFTRPPFEPFTPIIFELELLEVK